MEIYSVNDLVVMEREFLRKLEYSVQVNAQSIQKCNDKINNNLELNFFAGTQNQYMAKNEIMSIDTTDAQNITPSRGR